MKKIYNSQSRKANNYWLKHHYLVIGLLMFLMPTFLNAQTVFSESFDSSSTPAGWLREATSGDGWKFSTLAGYEVSPTLDHTANGGNYAWVDFSGTDNNVRLTTPVIDISTLGTAETFQGNTPFEWDERSIILLAPYTFNGGNSAQIRFRCESGGASNDFHNDILIDDVSVREAPTCFKPGNLAVSNVGTTSAEFAWTANTGETAWEIAIQPDGTGAPTGAGTPITTNPYTATNLSSATNYEYYIRANCGGGDYSYWAKGTDFMTPCAAQVAPWIEDFSTNSTPICWSENGSESWRYNTSAGYAAGNALDHTGNGGNYAWIDGSSPSGANQISTVTSEFIDVSGLTSPQFSYWVFSHNPTDNTYNTLTTEIYDGATWHTTSTINSDQGTAWNNITFDLQTLAITGPVQVRFTIAENSPGSSFYNDILIDDIEIRETPGCAAPSGLSATNIMTTTADLAWSENGSAALWNIELGTTGFTATETATHTGVSNSYTMSGLSAATGYDYYVQADCGGGELSDWTGPFSFNTPAMNAVCSTATDLAICDGTATGNTTFGELYTGSTCSEAVTANGVWYKLTGVTTGDYKASLCGSTFDTKLHVFSGDCASLTCIDGNDDTCGVQSEVSFSATAGTDYYVLVSGFGSNTGDFTLVMSDESDPTIAASDYTLVLGCGGTNTNLTLANVSASSTDNCTAAPSLALSQELFTAADMGANTVTVTATDDAGNESTTDVTITVINPSYVFVNDDAVGANNGSTWADAFSKLEDALTAAAGYGCVDTKVWVAAGTYVPTTGTDRNATFSVPVNLSLQGGFAGTEPISFDPTTRDMAYVAANLTTLSGDIGIAADPTDNSYTVVTMQEDAKELSGFTIQDGQADAPGNTAPLAQRSGAGVMNMSDAMMYELIIKNNTAQSGAGMYNNGQSGGASPTMDRVTFDGNIAAFDGGALYNDGRAGNCSPVITNAVFMNNSSGATAAGIYNNGRIGGVCAPVIAMSTFAGNSSPNGGVAILNDEASPTISSCNFTNNGTSSPIIDFNSDVTISGSNVEGYYQDQMNQPSMFVVAPSPVVPSNQWDLSLQSDSPLIGMGDGSIAPSYAVKDRAGNQRIQHGAIDIGAYETAFALPVELITFEGESRYAEAYLIWTTANEVNSAYFEVEHSLDGRAFASIGKVAAQGESSTLQFYDFTHELPAKGVNYYRLKQVDNDGSFEYSRIVALSFSKAAVEVYPNPAIDHVVVVIDKDLAFDKHATINVYNSLSQLVQTQTMSTENYKIKVNDLPNGTYIIQVNIGNQIFNKQIIIAN